MKGIVSKCSFLIMAILVSVSSLAQSRFDSIEKAIIEVVKAYKERDAVTLNKYMLKEKGMIVLYRPGAFDTYDITSAFDFKNPVPEYWPYDNILTDFKVRFEHLPKFRCEDGMPDDEAKWNKIGLYCDTTCIDKLASGIAKFLYEFELGSSKEEIREIEELEKNSCRVVLVDKEQNDFVFYLTWINGKWYLTIFDRVSSDCSA